MDACRETRSRTGSGGLPAPSPTAHPYRPAVDDEQLVAVTLTRREWAIVQEALDVYCDQVEHAEPAGLRKATRERNRARREELLDTLPRLDVALHQQAGVGPLFAE